MNHGLSICRSLILLFLTSAMCHADDTDGQTRVINHHGFFAFENGQIVKGVSGTSNEEINKGWLDRLLIQFTTEFIPSERIKFIMSVESQFGFSYPQKISDRSTYLSRFWLYPADVEALYTLGNLQQSYLQFGFGYFPFKYDKYVRNLGEFLFRSGTYPPYIVNSFNMPFARLLGFKVSSMALGSLRQDLLFTSDAQIFPTQDFSLSYLTHYTIGKCLELGAGIEFAHLFSINEQLTSPDTFSSIDNKHQTMYIKENGDTGYYTFKGIKPMVSLGFDLKPLLPSAIAALMSPNDAVLYGEACVIGWTNYKNYNTDTNMAYPDYSDRMDRTVAMVGANIPSFKLFDVLSLELEYDPNKYPNSYLNVIESNLPTYLVLPSKNLTTLRWSIYAKKTFLDKFCLIGQVALDHMRPPQPSYIQTERDDVLSRHGDWWWALRLLVNY